MGDQDTPITDGKAAENDKGPDPGLIRFIARHRPTLPVGNYKIAMSQQIDISGETKDILTFPDQYVAVRGERFSLKADWIQSVFPPQGGQGDYENCLPHIVITPGTLPWERTANRNGEGENRVPWLALLVLDDPEAGLVRSETILLKDLDQVGKPGLRDNLETGESPLPFLCFMRRLLFAHGVRKKGV